MKIKTLKLSNGEVLTLDDGTLLGKGAEGIVYRIKKPAKYAKDYCIKLYRTEEKAEKMESKITYMCKNKPITSSFVQLCWPEQSVYHRGKFKGYLMPLAFENSCNLLEIKPVNFKDRLQLPQAFKDKFDLQSEKGIVGRLKLCTNLAAAFYILHQSQKYIVVDMKPDNVLITSDAKVSVVDCDSFQVIDNGKLLYESNIFTPEYAPPELYHNGAIRQKEVYWDNFSFAVITYELLFGVHPFNATYMHPYDKEKDIASKIKSGLFVHGSKKRYLSGLDSEHPHNKFDKLPPAIQKLFWDAFEIGYNYPEKRTSLAVFGETFARSIETITPKKKVSTALLNKQVHFYRKWLEEFKKIVNIFKKKTLALKLRNEIV